VHATSDGCEPYDARNRAYLLPVVARDLDESVAKLTSPQQGDSGRTVGTDTAEMRNVVSATDPQLRKS
jgi:hypothetical protein